MAVHFKAYPIIYLPALLICLDEHHMYGCPPPPSSFKKEEEKKKKEKEKEIGIIHCCYGR